MTDISRRKLVSALGVAGLMAGCAAPTTPPPGGGGGGTPPGGGGVPPEGGGGTPPGGGGGTPPGGGGGIPPSGGSRLRRDASAMSAGDPTMQAYAEAVRQMRALPASDPRSWTAQAQIHLDRCPHGNWWFLPWHRAYLVHFEDICRGLLGNENFALPYWNWSRNGSIPAPFLDPSSPLFHPGRTAGAGASAAAELVSFSSVENQVMSATSFELFGSGRAVNLRDVSTMGALEAQPHNHIHVFVGGDMASFLSPRDPVFWLHHANVDRLWNAWNARGNANPNEASWGNMNFPGFVNRGGGAVSSTAAQMRSINGLGYGYETLSIARSGVGGAVEGFLNATSQNRFPVSPLRGGLDMAGGLAQSGAALVRSGAAYGARRVYTAPEGLVCEPLQPVAARIRPDRSVLAAAAPFAALDARSAGDAPQEGIIVDLGDIEGPQNENVIVRVFVNCDYLSRSTPPDDPHYVGSFSFFSTRYATNFCSTTGLGIGVTLDATRTLQRVARPDGDIVVQMISVPVNGRSVANAEFAARSIQVGVA